MNQANLFPEQERELRQILAELERRNATEEQIRASAPQTPEQLWDAVYQLTGYEIPRVAVCLEHGHVAPFDIFAGVYFAWPGWLDVMMIGNRGGGKTVISGFVHAAKGRWLSNYKTALAGATEMQADRGYSEFKRFTRSLDNEIVSSLMKATHWLVGSFTEVLTATMRQMNGPHPHLAELDEVELLSRRQIFEEFNNMAQGDERYPSQNLLSSTRKFVFGLVQEIVSAAENATRRGDEPEWKIAIFCVFETLAEVPNCQRAPQHEREARLKELGRDPCELCQCHTVKKGIWDDGSERIFTDVCRGRAFRSRGFLRLEDAWRRFRRLLRATWEAQQECLTPDPEGLVHKWLRAKYIIPVWYPYPEFGEVYRSWDWGGTNPHSVHLHQVLDRPVHHVVKEQITDPDTGEQYEEIAYEHTFREGDIVTFDEVYHSGGSYRQLGKEVLQRTEAWRSIYGFQVRKDVADPAGLTQKADVREAATDFGFPEPDFNGGNAPPRVESVQKHQEWGEDGRLYIAGPYCPNLLEEYAGYHYPDTKDGKNASEDPVKLDDHALDENRLFFWWLFKHSARERQKAEAPGAVPKPAPRRDGPVIPDKRPPMLGTRRVYQATLNDAIGGQRDQHYDEEPDIAVVRRSGFRGPYT